MGKKVKYNKNHEEMIATTKKYLDSKVPNIYGATFSYDGIVIKVDILRVCSDGVDIYEVKSSTQVKDIYLHDVSILYFVLENLGFKIKSANIIHINSQYTKEFKLDIKQLFKIVDVTSSVQELQSDIPNNLKEFDTYLSDEKNEPNIDIRKYCHNSYFCDAKEYCWKVQRQITDYSIDIKMTSIQLHTVKKCKEKTTYIDVQNIKSFIKNLEFPIYFLDFETYQQAIPQYDGIKPFEQIPFQYSLHILCKNGRLKHKEFLASDNIDGRYELALRLWDDIPEDATVLACNTSFEKGVIKKLVESFPYLGS